MWQCCGTVTIFYGSGSGSTRQKVTVPTDPVPVPVEIRIRDQDPYQYVTDLSCLPLHVFVIVRTQCLRFSASAMLEGS